jgi:glutamate N-acetyltransferase/amino-acid N-acetyltransferase
MESIKNGVCAAKGFKAAGINVGIKPGSVKKDLALIYCEKQCNTAALYTTNKVQAAPIKVSKSHLADGKARAVIVNSGNANACTADGVRVAEKMCALTADALGIPEEDVVVASTGVIGQSLSIAPIERGIPALVAGLSVDGSDDAVAAIMTTDTFPKQSAAGFTLGSSECGIGGIAKGSGMINPLMDTCVEATMLAFITTDTAISSAMLEKALRGINEDTFNMVSVDGDTSTNDMVCVMASGLAGNGEIVTEGEDYEVFCLHLRGVMEHLAKELARDGEGATKLIECTVTGAPSKCIAKSIAKSVISSSLVKAALGAADANWGRILCAMGYAGCSEGTGGQFDLSRAEVSVASEVGEVYVCRNGVGVDFSEEEAFKILSEAEIKLNIKLNSGNGEATAWGCDLTKEYVSINADYRS